MRKYSFSYLMSNSFKGFSRNGFMSFVSVLILTSCLLISGCFGLLIYNIYINLNELNELNEIVCICKYEKFTKEQLDDIYQRLESLNGVESVKYTSSAEALEKMREKYAKYPLTLSKYTDENNPLPEVYTISYSGDESTAVNLLFKLRSEDEFPEFKSVDDRVETANMLEKLKNTILWVFVGFMAILLVISVVIIMNTIRISITTRKKEIEVMRYCGATSWFISFPFMVEALFMGLISALIAFGLQVLAYDYLNGILVNDSTKDMIRITPFADVWYYVLAGFTVLSFLTCYIGAKISLSKHTRV